MTRVGLQRHRKKGGGCIRRGVERVRYSAPNGKENEIQVLLKFKETQNWWEIFMNQTRLHNNENLPHRKIDR